MRASLLSVVVFCLAILAQPTLAATTEKAVKTDAKKTEVKAPAPEKAQEENEEASFNSIVLRGLNKVTARSQLIDGPVGTAMRFGNLEIVATRCWKSPPEDQPENAALLEISELKPNESPSRIFSGWMFSSSPGLSALQHPVYDITVVSCNVPEEKAAVKPNEAKGEPKPDVKTDKSETDQKPARKPEDEPDPSDNPLD